MHSDIAIIVGKIKARHGGEAAEDDGLCRCMA